MPAHGSRAPDLGDDDPRVNMRRDLLSLPLDGQAYPSVYLNAVEAAMMPVIAGPMAMNERRVGWWQAGTNETAEFAERVHAKTRRSSSLMLFSAPPRAIILRVSA
jgi:hypothetical protein